MRSIHRRGEEKAGREEGKRNIREFRPRFRSRFRFAAARILKSSFAPRTIETRRTNAWPISRKAWCTRTPPPPPPPPLSHDTRRLVGRFLDIFEPLYKPADSQGQEKTSADGENRENRWGPRGRIALCRRVDDVRRPRLLVDRERERERSQMELETARYHGVFIQIRASMP